MTTKRFKAFSVLLVVAACTQAVDAALASGEVVITEKGPHHRVWSKTVQEKLENGDIVSRTVPAYTELGTGLHYWSEDQKDWVESRAEIQIINGHGVAVHGQHQVIFSPNLNSDVAIDLLTPDGKRFKSRILGLAYFSAATGKSVLFAQVKDSIGQLWAPDQVVYPDAFTGVKIDVRFKYRLDGFEQDLIFLEAPPSPEQYGLDSASSRMELYTEFIDPPIPVIEDRMINQVSDRFLRNQMVEPDFTDVFLRFGAMSIGNGAAFGLPQDHDDGETVPVGKFWGVRDGHTVLVERVNYQEIEPKLRGLPQAAVLAKSKGNRAVAKVGSKRREWLFAGGDEKRQPQVGQLQLAKAQPPKKAVVWDYSILNSDTNFTFRGDTTYFISNTVNLSLTTTIQAGTVIKYAGGSQGDAVFFGPIVCNTTQYRPAIFTAKDDDSVGEKIAGSTGSPIAWSYGSHTFNLFSSTNLFDLHDLRLWYQTRGFNNNKASPLVIRHSQFNLVGSPLWSIAGPVTFRNVLVYKPTSVAYTLNSTNILDFVCENVTFHDLFKLRAGSIGNFLFTNTLLICITNTTVPFSGSNNQTNNSDSGIFSTVGAGAHYLGTNGYRAAGTTNINPTLLADLANRTTYAPTILNTLITNSTVLGQVVARNTGTPDLGYHYDPLDYLVTGVVATNNAVVSLVSGVAVGFDFSTGPYGLKLDGGAQFSSVGNPTNLNRLVRTHAVQESSSTTAGSNGVPTIAVAYPGTNGMTARFQFSDLPQLAGNYYHFLDTTNQGKLEVLTFKDSQIRGGQLYVSPSQSSYRINLTNNLFEQVSSTIYEFAAMTAFAYNNTFREGSLTLSGSLGTNWLFKDNLFDKTTISENASATVSHDYNGYVTNYSRLNTPYGGHDRILSSSPAYDSFVLGNYYLPTNSTLITVGSRTADLAGLWHYTTVTNQVTETNGTVSIGFHYVAVDTNGLPLDTDGDGYPDYLEDSNGNGSVDSGETDWQNANDLGFRVLITRPRSGSPLP